MKNVLLAGVLVIWAMIGLAGEITSEIDQPFNAVRCLGNYNVTLKKGAEQQIQINNRDEEGLSSDRILFEVDDETLIVRIKGDTYLERELDIVITYTELKEVSAKYGSRITVEDVLTSENLRLTTESGGKIKAKVETNTLETAISAGGSIRVEGNCKKAAHKVKVGGAIAAAYLNADETKASVTAGGEVICTATNRLAIKITSGGTVSYWGKPEMFEQDISLGGKISQIEKPKTSDY